MVILDTSIIIDHVRRNHNQETLLVQIANKITNYHLSISVITIQELFRGTSTRNSEDLQFLNAIIGSLHVVSYTYEIAQKAGEIGRDRQEVIQFADAAIAATAIVNTAQLATLNAKDFLHIPGLEIYKMD